MRNNSHELRLGNKKEKKCFFILYCSHLSLSLNKIGCGSAIKKKKSVFSFCIALTFHYLCIYILCNDRKRLWNYQ